MRRAGRGCAGAIRRGARSFAGAGARIDDVEIQHARNRAIYLHLVLADAAAYHAATLERCRRGTRRRCGSVSKWGATCWRRITSGRCGTRTAQPRSGCGAGATRRPDSANAADSGAGDPREHVEINGAAEPARNLMLRLTQPFNVTGHPRSRCRRDRPRMGCPARSSSSASGGRPTPCFASRWPVKAWSVVDRRSPERRLRRNGISGGGTGLMSGGGLSLDRSAGERLQASALVAARCSDLATCNYTSRPIARISSSALLCSTMPGASGSRRSSFRPRGDPRSACWRLAECRRQPVSARSCVVTRPIAPSATSASTTLRRRCGDRASWCRGGSRRAGTAEAPRRAPHRQSIECGGSPRRSASARPGANPDAQGGAEHEGRQPSRVAVTGAPASARTTSRRPRGAACSCPTCSSR